MGRNDTLEFEMTQGEDWAVQIFWTDEDGDPIPVISPCRMEVRDTTGALILQFADANAAATKPSVTITGSQGLLQLSCPTVYSKTVNPGMYLCDLWVTANNGVSPFTAQDVPVASGRFIVMPRQTIMEGAIV